MIYFVDSNTVTDILIRNPVVSDRFVLCREAGHRIALCHPVQYEVSRGLLWRDSHARLRRFQEVKALMTIVPVQKEDWEQAARFWANARRQGRQFSDVDLILAAMANRREAVLVSADRDFTALPIALENWREDPA